MAAKRPDRVLSFSSQTHEKERPRRDMMANRHISHISLTVSDLDRSTAFYDEVFEFIGLKRVEVPDATQQAMKTRLKPWVGLGYSISIRPSKGEFAHRLHDRNALDLTIW